MATAVQKIILSSSRDIPFNKLLLSQSNVRRVKAGVSIEDLAASIARRGLIQSLSVLPVVDAEGNETGMFEVPAGGRRFRALELLVKQKRLAKIAPVPCIVRDRDGAILPEEVSLAENIERAPLHPLDQFRAFHDMLTKGMTEEEIAAAFFVPVNVVKQRLRLATVSPALHDVYADDGMTLEQLMAFTVSENHERPPRHQQRGKPRDQAWLWSDAIEKSEVVARREATQDLVEITLMNGDALRQARLRDVLTRERNMDRILLDCVDENRRTCGRKTAGSVAERGTQFEDPPRTHVGGQYGQRRAV